MINLSTKVTTCEFKLELRFKKKKKKPVTEKGSVRTNPSYKITRLTLLFPCQNLYNLYEVPLENNLRIM